MFPAKTGKQTNLTKNNNTILDLLKKHTQPNPPTKNKKVPFILQKVNLSAPFQPPRGLPLEKSDSGSPSVDDIAKEVVRSRNHPRLGLEEWHKESQKHCSSSHIESKSTKYYHISSNIIIKHQTSNIKHHHHHHHHKNNNNHHHCLLLHHNTRRQMAQFCNTCAPNRTRSIGKCIYNNPLTSCLIRGSTRLFRWFSILQVRRSDHNTFPKSLEPQWRACAAIWRRADWNSPCGRKTPEIFRGAESETW